MVRPAIISGMEHKYAGDILYKKTSADDEIVFKRFVKRVSDTEFQLVAASTEIPHGFCPEQVNSPGTDTTSSLYPQPRSSDYAHDGMPLDVRRGQGIVNGTLATSQTIVVGDRLMCDAGGLVKKWATGSNDVIVGTANESVTTTTATADIRIIISSLPALGDNT